MRATDYKDPHKIAVEEAIQVGQLFGTEGSGHGMSQPYILQTPVIAELKCRIRRLTPKECWRLMGFDDEAVEHASAVVSNSQLYKQAGNSIVKDVLVAIFGQMI